MKRLRRILLLLVLLLLLGGGIAGVIARFEGGAPALVFTLSGAMIGQHAELSGEVRDTANGIRRLTVLLSANGIDTILLDEQYPASIFSRGAVREKAVRIPIEPKTLGVPDGPAVIRITAADYSWRGFGRGNVTGMEKHVVIDTKPPEIGILSRAHNLGRGGTGLVLYRVSEKCAKTGVVFGDRFYPGFAGGFSDKTVRTAFFAWPEDMADVSGVRVTAVDEAGNETSTGFRHHLRRRTFRTDKIRISDGFLRRKLPEFSGEKAFGDTESPIERFVRVNRDLRKENYTSILAATAKSEPAFLWRGAFLRLPNSARMAGFADRREYIYQGRVIDRQIHLGVDLASVAGSPVPAANSGKVVWADRIGIYGKTVILDHGFGLFSMYAHLSDIRADVGTSVEKGDIIGRTGKTGLAGGDHLHFGMLVSGTFVEPVEWWDPEWIQNNISGRIEGLEPGLRLHEG